LDDIDGTEGATGTCNIWSTDLLGIKHLTDDPYRGLRLIIDAQTTLDGYFEIGCMVIGAYAVFGYPYSWGRISRLETNTQISTSQDGSRRTRVHGPPRRSVEFGWVDGVDLTPVSGASPSDDYCLGTDTANAMPIATRTDAPLLMAGLLEHLDGPHKHVVYVPTLPKGTPDSVQYVSRDRFLYGRVTSAISIENVQGEEIESEVVRTNNLLIEEDV